MPTAVAVGVVGAAVGHHPPRQGPNAGAADSPAQAASALLAAATRHVAVPAAASLLQLHVLALRANASRMPGWYAVRGQPRWRLDSVTGRGSPPVRDDDAQHHTASRRYLAKERKRRTSVIEAAPVPEDLVTFGIVEPEPDLFLAPYASGCYILHSNPFELPRFATRISDKDEDPYARIYQLQDVFSAEFPSMTYESDSFDPNVKFRIRLKLLKVNHAEVLEVPIYMHAIHDVRASDAGRLPIVAGQELTPPLCPARSRRLCATPSPPAGRAAAISAAAAASAAVTRRLIAPAPQLLRRQPRPATRTTAATRPAAFLPFAAAMEDGDDDDDDDDALGWRRLGGATATMAAGSSGGAVTVMVPVQDDGSAATLFRAKADELGRARREFLAGIKSPARPCKPAFRKSSSNSPTSDQSGFFCDTFLTMSHPCRWVLRRVLATFAVVTVVFAAVAAAQRKLTPQEIDERAQAADAEIWHMGPGVLEERIAEGSWLVFFGARGPGDWNCCDAAMFRAPVFDGSARPAQKYLEEDLIEKDIYISKVDCTEDE
ncbi:hypothetical protein HK405_006552, partial [Cladochytrium tenue]